MKYRALTNESFYYIDSKRMAIVMKNNKNFTKNELFSYIKENNIIEANNEKNRVKKSNTLYKRLSSINEFLLERLADESADIGKFIVFVSIILNEKIYFDFLNEVIKDKFYLLDKTIDNTEIIRFMSEKSEQIEEVAKWTDESKKKIIVRMKSYFIEAGYLVRRDKESKEFIVARPLIPADITESIVKEYGNIIAQALLVK